MNDTSRRSFENYIEPLLFGAFAITLLMISVFFGVMAYKMATDQMPVNRAQVESTIHIGGLKK